jgi:hypothetical protein
MIYLISTESGRRPALVAKGSAFPIHEKPFGWCSPILLWEKANLRKPSYIVFSKATDTFDIIHKIGDLDYDDRLRAIRNIPDAARDKLTVLV